MPKLRPITREVTHSVQRSFTFSSDTPVSVEVKGQRPGTWWARWRGGVASIYSRMLSQVTLNETSKGFSFEAGWVSCLFQRDRSGLFVAARDCLWVGLIAEDRFAGVIVSISAGLTHGHTTSHVSPFRSDISCVTLFGCFVLGPPGLFVAPRRPSSSGLLPPQWQNLIRVTALRK